MVGQWSLFPCSLNNPNKVRSFAICVSHRSDDAGYEILADIIIKPNKINPQIGSRFAGTFNSWKAFGEPYSSNMKKQLERINAAEDLGKDIREIASKPLA